MQEHHIGVRRTARYYTLGEMVEGGALWIVCHGYAQLARYFLRAFEPLNDGTRLIVAPEALNRYYYETAPGVHAQNARVAASWMTREDRDNEIVDYVAYLDALASHLTRVAKPGRLIALGFSQGAATVSRWAGRGSTAIDDVILWGSGIAHELQPAPALLRGARLTIAIGDSDEHVSDDRVAREDRRLRESGMDYRLVRYAGGHRVEPDGLRQVAALIRNGR